MPSRSCRRARRSPSTAGASSSSPTSTAAPPPDSSRRPMSAPSDHPPLGTVIVTGGSSGLGAAVAEAVEQRSEEHTSELQSHVNLVCRLLLEKKKKTTKIK